MFNLYVILSWTLSLSTLNWFLYIGSTWQFKYILTVVVSKFHVKHAKPNCLEFQQKVLDNHITATTETEAAWKMSYHNIARLIINCCLDFSDPSRRQKSDYQLLVTIGYIITFTLAAYFDIIIMQKNQRHPCRH